MNKKEKKFIAKFLEELLASHDPDVNPLMSDEEEKIARGIIAKTRK